VGTEVLGVDVGADDVAAGGLEGVDEDDCDGAGVGVADEGSDEGVADAAGVGRHRWCLPQCPAWCVAE
jgi:hypothetical protein